MELKRTVGWFVLIFGVFLLIHGWDTSEAQEGVEPKQAWEIYHSAYGPNHFYVIKHNRLTGETLVLDARSGIEDDAWLLIPEEDRRSSAQR